MNFEEYFGEGQTKVLNITKSLIYNDFESFKNSKVVLIVFCAVRDNNIIHLR